jgi:hypothetical protein
MKATEKLGQFVYCGDFGYNTKGMNHERNN